MIHILILPIIGLIIILLFRTFEFIMLYCCLAAVIFTISRLIVDFADFIDPLTLIILLIIFILDKSRV